MLQKNMRSFFRSKIMALSPRTSMAAKITAHARAGMKPFLLIGGFIQTIGEIIAG
jgi:hypothetical protein